MINKMFKRGVSPIIATVLLLVITIVAVGILAAFVIPFVKNSLGNTKECFNEIGNIKIEETSYNCYASQTTPISKNRTGFSVRIEGNEIVGFEVTMFKGGSANTKKIENNTISREVRMLDRDFNIGLDVPRRGGVRTYVLNDIYNKIEINPVLKNGAICRARESLNILPCNEPNIARDLLEF